MKKHKVELICEKRQTLETLVRKGEHSELKLMRAQILLKADRGTLQQKHLASEKIIKVP